jgi:copper chaperone NosL
MMMDRLSRTALAGLALALVACLFLPLWRVALIAPQYPEGLGFYIWANRMSGDLQSINGLNHYIGMKQIVPESIPELRLMPWALGGLVAAGLGAAAWGRRKALAAWVALLALGALAGLADFWKWGYDYGHDLDPTAAIKIPGMSYQPPVLGSKQLLNFHATSLPAVGGWIAFGVLAVGLVLVIREFRRGRRLAAAGA